MKSGTITLIIIVAIVAILGFNGCSTYNKLVQEKETVDQKWADVQNQYQRRLDLIPNLVATVKGYAEHEKSTYENVTRARAGLDNALQNAQGGEAVEPGSANFNAYNQAQSDLGRALNLYVNAVHEAYPDLKANDQFMGLQTQLEGTENRIATFREYYTQSVKEYNILVKRFPANIWAGIFGYSAMPQFAADQAAQHAPKVEF